MDGKSQIDIRELSFRDRALYELKVAKVRENIPIIGYNLG